MSRERQTINVRLGLTERIEAYENIIKHLPDQGNGRSRRLHYQEKCDIYRRVLMDLDRKHEAANEKISHPC